MTLRTLCVLITLTLVASSCATLPGDDQKIEFALVGDNPYFEANEPRYLAMIDAINARSGLAWVIHLGDIKGGSQPCSDEFLRNRYDLNRRFDLPFILTPGDNDWFDCHREPAGSRDRLERLGFLRQLFYANAGQTLGPDPFRGVSQSTMPEFSDYVENLYWRRNDVLFATVHLVGLIPGEGGIDIHNRMMEAALAWIDEVFRVANEENARGVFLATQVDPYPATIDPALLKIFCSTCPYVRPGYELLDQALKKHVREFGRPVVLATGDTHIFRVDKPLYDGKGRVIENFTRVETFGHPTVHWVRIVVDPASSELFQFHQELVPGNIGAIEATE